MANLVAIVGPSGHGKSSSLGENEKLGIKGLDPKETVLINVAGKPLPIGGWRKNYSQTVKIADGGNYIETSDSDTIVKILQHVSDKRSDIKNIIIEDKR